ncbi:adenylate cyclase type 7 isoform X1 [Lates japonicus]|uniref:Adenylate cyclase type 7 isoform X1 n=1 Tax=Lates japonicus TaxID=270547 RepID=A0AAD3MNB9_LATJO|nr:adenylate cyclase type 7 isoform X1 [Lates japonicus]
MLRFLFECAGRQLPGVLRDNYGFFWLVVVMVEGPTTPAVVAAGAGPAGKPECGCVAGHTIRNNGMFHVVQGAPGEQSRSPPVLCLRLITKPTEGANMSSWQRMRRPAQPIHQTEDRRHRRSQAKGRETERLTSRDSQRGRKYLLNHQMLKNEALYRKFSCISQWHWLPKKPAGPPCSPVPFFLFIIFTVYTMLPFQLWYAVVLSIISSLSHIMALAVHLTIYSNEKMTDLPNQENPQSVLPVYISPPEDSWHP